MPQMGKIFFMNTDGFLFQHDIINQSRLSPVSLSGMVPMNQSRILDYVLEPTSGNLFILKENWLLEVWDTVQAKSSPVQKLRLVQDDTSSIDIDQLYKNRHLGKFPNFLSLSTHTRNFLVVNMTCINESIVLIDPVSLSVLNTIFFSSDDMKIPKNLNKILWAMKSTFDEISKKQDTFENIFRGMVTVSGETKRISRANFLAFLHDQVDFVKNDLSAFDMERLCDYLDQDSDGWVSTNEWIYLQELIRTVSKRTTVHAMDEIPAALRNIEKEIVKIFLALYDFIKRSGFDVIEIFRIFDKDGSGYINSDEFCQLLEEIIPEAETAHKKKFIRWVDFNNDHKVSLEEFHTIFKQFGDFTLDELMPNENPRKDMYVVIEKAYECDIDVGSSLSALDEFEDGSIEVHHFKHF
jgi:Ca2+-binding EF-hand superfamily protein